MNTPTETTDAALLALLGELFQPSKLEIYPTQRTQSHVVTSIEIEHWLWYFERTFQVSGYLSYHVPPLFYTHYDPSNGTPSERLLTLTDRLFKRVPALTKDWESIEPRWFAMLRTPDIEPYEAYISHFAFRRKLHTFNNMLLDDPTPTPL